MHCDLSVCCEFATQRESDSIWVHKHHTISTSAIGTDGLACCMQKHFLALLILAQQTNTGQQSMPAPDEPAAHGNCSPQGLCLGQAMMILISSTDMSAHASDYVIPSSLQMMLTSAAGCQP